MKRRFVAFYYFNGCYNFSLGFSIDFFKPNIEIHLPLGFIRIGWEDGFSGQKRFGFIDRNTIWR